MDIKDFEPLFGNWYVESLIGAGSFGKVYKIKREEFGAVYYSALKWISIPRDESEMKQLRYDGLDNASISEYYKDVVTDLVNEMQLMSRLRGRSSIVSYEDHSVVPKSNNMGYDIFIRMELLISLNDYMQTHELSRADVIRLGINLCEALELCQKYNIIHRDIKPDNIFVAETGEFKLGDFGIARQLEKTTASLSIKGTYYYMAPEVYKGDRYNSSVDTYSLGIVLYRLLNGGRLPFLPLYPAPVRQKDRDQSLVRRMSGEQMVPPQNTEGRLGDIVLKACAYDPKDRYSSPRQMREELQAIQYTKNEAKYIYKDGDNLGKIEPSKNVEYNSEVTSEAEINDQVLNLVPNDHKQNDLRPPKNAKVLVEESDKDITLPIVSGRRANQERLKKSRPSHLKDKNTDSFLNVSVSNAGENKENIQTTCENCKVGSDQADETICVDNIHIKNQFIPEDENYLLDVTAGVEKAYNAQKGRGLSDKTPVFIQNQQKSIHTKSKNKALNVKMLIACIIAIIAAITGWLLIHPQKSSISLEDSSQLLSRKFSVSPLGECTAISKSGEVLSTYRFEDESTWMDVQAVSIADDRIVGLKGDGTVVVAYNPDYILDHDDVGFFSSNDYGKNNIDRWNNITQITLSYLTTIGLKKNGTVIAAGDNERGELDVSKWRNIMQIACTESFTIGLRSDGRVLIAGYDNALKDALASWRDIVYITASERIIAGIKADGTVVTQCLTGSIALKTDDWTNIIQIAAGTNHLIGLRQDGTVVGTGSNYFGQLNVETWSNIVAISASGKMTAGLKATGGLCVTGKTAFPEDKIRTWHIF